MDQLDKIKAPIATLVDNFHSQFAEILATKSEWLGRAIELLSASTGKKVRPILVALLSGLPEGKSPAQRSIDAAVLLELIHTATLIHDDVIDEAKTRRGRPTLGAIFDNRVAVLMGDFILSSALIGAIALRDLEVMAIVSGIGRELTEGEIRQFESAGSLRLDEAYYKGDVGKPTGNDLREGKVTLPLLHVLLQQPDSPETKEALAILSQHPLSEEGVARLTELAIKGGGIRYAEERLMHYIDEAKQLILHYPDSAYRQSLLALADYIAARSY